MAEILIVYATTDGQTLRISRRLEQGIERYGHRVTLMPVREALTSDVHSFDKLVVGASIRYGKHDKLVSRFITNHLRALETKPSALFSVNLVARKPDKNLPETNPYLLKFLRKIPWRPDVLAVFAGRIDYRQYRFWDRQIIRLIMWMTKGPTDPDTVIEYTDWQQVDEFAEVVSQM